MKNNDVTIRDVAREAGVSVGTVSHVLNGSKRHVSAGTREHVLSVAQSLQYRPNVIARSMVKGATATIGLVIMELNNPLFVPVTEGVESVLQPEGYNIVLASCHDMDSEMQAVETLRGRQVDGFIFMSLSVSYPNDHLLDLKKQGVPFVIINRVLEHPDINRVLIDDVKAAFDITKHLLDLGHLNIATITGPRNVRHSAVNRHLGWEAALKERGIEPAKEWIIEGDYTYEGGLQAVRYMLQKQRYPTALFVANESMAVGALKGLNSAGLRIPQDIAVVTVGDPPFAAYTSPALTTMALPVEEAGRLAARQLVNWIKENKPDPVKEITLNAVLKIRESCGFYLKNQLENPTNL